MLTMLFRDEPINIDPGTDPGLKSWISVIFYIFLIWTIYVFLILFKDETSKSSI